MSEAKFSVIGGKMKFPKLNLALLKEDEKQFQVARIVTWLNMLNDMMIPVHWYQTNKSGTNVKFNQIHNQKEYDLALIDLEAEIKRVNLEYDLDLSLNKEATHED